MTLVSVQSPRLAELLRTAPGETFWRELAALGSPLVEPVDDTTDQARVTFIYRARAAGDAVGVFGGPFGLAVQPLDRVDGTDVLATSVVVPADARFTYALIADPPQPFPSDFTEIVALYSRAFPDPLNPRQEFSFPDDPDTGQDGFFASSVTELPAAVPNRWLDELPSERGGTTRCEWLDSGVMGDARRVWVHLPAERDGGGEPCPLVVLLDGLMAVRSWRWSAIAANLAAAGATVPFVSVMVDNPPPAVMTRTTELACNERFAAYVAEEVVPWARDRFGAGVDTRSTVVAGASFGGLAASFCALRHPGVFDSFVSCSGSYWWAPPDGGAEWLVDEWSSAARLPSRVHLSVGRFETGAAPTGSDMIRSNRAVRDVLRARGVEVEYVEYPGYHDTIWWQQMLPQAIAFVAGAWPRSGGVA